jgi:hypothetical protein
VRHSKEWGPAGNRIFHRPGEPSFSRIALSSQDPPTPSELFPPHLQPPSSNYENLTKLPIPAGFSQEIQLANRDQHHSAYAIVSHRFHLPGMHSLPARQSRYPLKKYITNILQDYISGSRGPSHSTGAHTDDWDRSYLEKQLELKRLHPPSSNHHHYALSPVVEGHQAHDSGPHSCDCCRKGSQQACHLHHQGTLTTQSYLESADSSRTVPSTRESPSVPTRPSPERPFSPPPSLDTPSP